jgi:hypothetical protein
VKTVTARRKSPSDSPLSRILAKWLSPWRAAQLHSDGLPLLIIAVGILFTLFLQTFNADGTFFSADGGLKFLLARQLSAGHLRFDLDLPVEQWVRAVWEQGLYPFEPPFVYKIGNRDYITFPFTFPLITAPFYALFGFKGIHIIPLVATWVTWVVFYQMCKQFQLGWLSTSVGLMTLIFASPLTIYSACYWEHTLAVALALSGLAIIFSQFDCLSTRRAILGSVLFGLAIWFREELICLAGALILMLIIPLQTKVLDRKYLIEYLKSFPRSKVILIFSLVLTISVFLLLNYLIYGHPLGAHSIQVLHESSLRDRLKDVSTNFQRLSSLLLQYFPSLVFLLLNLPISLFRNDIKDSNKVKILYVISILFLLVVPFILPGDPSISLESRTGGKQWGPRLLLILVPTISLLVAITFQSVVQSRNHFLRYLGSAICVGLLIAGIYVNPYSYAANLFQESRQPNDVTLLQAVAKTSSRVVAASHQYVNQDMVYLFNQKDFFLVKDTKDLQTLGAALATQNIKDATYICYAHRPCPLPQTGNQLTITTPAGARKIQFQLNQKIGKTAIYNLTINSI